MAKFHGVVGYASQIETSPGVFTDYIVEKEYRGDIFKKVRKQEGDDRINKNLVLQNTISIIANLFAYQNIPHIRYVEWLDTRWEVTNAVVERPRIILSIGEVYNGEGPTP